MNNTELQMKSGLFGLAIALSSVSAFAVPATAQDFNRANSKYCLATPSDPVCMDDAGLQTRKAFISFDKNATMENRSKYCLATPSDPVCQEAVMKSEGPVKDFKRADSKYCLATPSDPVCMDDAGFANMQTSATMTKEWAMENRSKYCLSTASDPVCQEPVKNSSVGFE